MVRKGAPLSPRPSACMSLSLFRRRYRLRKKFKIMRKAATKIQATFHMYKARKALHKKLESVALLQVSAIPSVSSCSMSFSLHPSDDGVLTSSPSKQGFLPHGQGEEEVHEAQEGHHHLPEVHSSLEGKHNTGAHPFLSLWKSQLQLTTHCTHRPGRFIRS